MNGGRFDFDDGGTYCGGWEEGKAHGHGVCTGPDGQGEYTGAWHYGFEVSGVYTWPSGSTYSGQWQNGKRHGLGVEQRGRWSYKGEWTQGYKGRYGRREALNSGAHYLGTWSSGLHDGYGTEIYADGGSYKGQWLRGMRHGYGIRTSAPWSIATPNNHQHHIEQKHKGGHTSLSSLRSNYGSAVMLNDERAATAMDTPPNHHGRSHSKERRGEQPIQIDESRGGFVLKAYSGTNKRRRSLSERSLAVKKSILQRIRKQNSTGDIVHQQRIFSAGGASSLRSSGSTLSCTSDEDDSNDLRHPPNSQRSRAAAEAAALEEPPIDANAVEIYRGEWKNDMRSGYGVCERSDGLRYAGEWLDNRKHGYGVTFFRDGTKEEGRYKHNVLVSSARRKGILFVRSTKLRHRVEIYAEHARQAADMAAQRVEIATSRTMTAQERADASVEAAERARDDGDTARIYAAQFDPSFKQPGVELLRARAAMQRAGTPAGLSTIPMLTPIHNHVMANHVQFNQQQQHSHTNYSTSPSQQHQQQYNTDYSNAFAIGPTSSASQQNIVINQMPPLPPFAQQQQQIRHKQTSNTSEWNGGIIGGIGQQQPHSPPQYSADSGITVGGGGGGSSNFSQQQQQRHLIHQQSSESGHSSQQQQQQDYITHPQLINEGGGSDTEGGLLVAASTSGGQHSAQHSNIVGYSAAIPPLPLSSHPRQQSSSSEMATLQKPQPPHQMRGMNNLRGRSSPSTMSLSDDHWDQYLLKSSRRGEASKHQLLPGTSSGGLETPHHFRRNRPSLIRQCEVLGASGTLGGSSGGESPSGSMTLNRRSTLVNVRECRQQRIPPIHSVYGADDHQQQHQQFPSSSADINQISGREDRGSLPNLEDLAGQPLQLGREEAAKLASQRRQDVHKQMEEEERLRQNPLRYLVHPSFRNWIIQWRIPLLLVIGNIILFYCFIHLLSGSKNDRRRGGGNGGGENAHSE